MTSYASRADVETAFGKSNVKKWADVNNDGNGADVEARVTWALESAYEYVNDRLREGPYTIPFVIDGTLPKTIVRMCAAYAGVLLYESRGIVDVDADGRAMHALKWHKDWVEDMIKKIHARQIKFLLTKTYKDYPVIVREDDTDQVNARLDQLRAAAAADQVLDQTITPRTVHITP